MREADFKPERLQEYLDQIKEVRNNLIVGHGEMPKHPSWEEITPVELRTAIGHIREEIEVRDGLTRMSVGLACRNSLKSFASTPAPLPSTLAQLTRKAHLLTVEEYGAAVTQYREKKIDPSQAQTLAEIFKAYADKYIDAIWSVIGPGFVSMQRIARVQRHLIRVSPIDWAHAHIDLLLCNEQRQLEHLIKEMCDTQEQYDPSQDIEDHISWRSWRAPLLIHMLPMGNSPYDHNRAWVREDEETTRKTLAALSRHILLGPVCSIERMAGKAHVEEAASQPLGNSARTRQQIESDLQSAKERKRRIDEKIGLFRELFPKLPYSDLCRRFNIHHERELYAEQSEAEIGVLGLESELRILPTVKADKNVDAQLLDEVAEPPKLSRPTQYRKWITDQDRHMAKTKMENPVKFPEMTAKEAAAALQLGKSAIYDHPRLEKANSGTKKILFTTQSVLAVKNSAPD